jgi:hypothetical protein
VEAAVVAVAVGRMEAALKSHRHGAQQMRLRSVANLPAVHCNRRPLPAIRQRARDELRSKSLSPTGVDDRELREALVQLIITCNPTTQQCQTSFISLCETHLEPSPGDQEIAHTLPDTVHQPRRGAGPPVPSSA